MICLVAGRRMVRCRAAAQRMGSGAACRSTRHRRQSRRRERASRAGNVARDGRGRKGARHGRGDRAGRRRSEYAPATRGGARPRASHGAREGHHSRADLGSSEVLRRRHALRRCNGSRLRLHPAGRRFGRRARASHERLGRVRIQGARVVHSTGSGLRDAARRRSGDAVLRGCAVRIRGRADHPGLRAARRRGARRGRSRPCSRRPGSGTRSRSGTC